MSFATTFQHHNLSQKVFKFQEKLGLAIKQVRALSNELMGLKPDHNQKNNFDEITEANRVLAKRIHDALDLNSLSIGINPLEKPGYSQSELATLDVLYSYCSADDNTGKNRISYLNQILKNLKKKPMSLESRKQEREAIAALGMNEDFDNNRKFIIKFDGDIWKDLKSVFSNSGLKQDLSQFEWFDKVKDNKNAMIDYIFGSMARLVSGNSRAEDKTVHLRNKPQIEWLENPNILIGIRAINHFAQL